MPKMNYIDWIAYTLLVIGGLNWGLIGLFEYDLVASIFGEMSIISKFVYVLVGVSALYMIFSASVKSVNMRSQSQHL